MASTISHVGAVSHKLLSLNSSSSGGSTPSSAFYGSGLKKVNSRFTHQKTSESKTFRIVAEIDEGKAKKKVDKWGGLAYDISDDQQDITRGKGLVDSLFQAPSGAGTHDPIMSSYKYLSTAQKTYSMDNNMDGFHIAPAFMDKLVVHLTKNYMTLPNIKVLAQFECDFSSKLDIKVCCERVELNSVE